MTLAHWPAILLKRFLALDFRLIMVCPDEMFHLDGITRSGCGDGTISLDWPVANYVPLVWDRLWMINDKFALGNSLGFRHLIKYAMIAMPCHDGWKKCQNSPVVNLTQSLPKEDSIRIFSIWNSARGSKFLVTFYTLGKKLPAMVYDSTGLLLHMK